MKKNLLLLISIIGYIVMFGLLPYVYAQTSDTGQAIIPPPAGGSETIQLPQIENLEVVPLTSQTSAIPETPTSIQPVQPSENVPQPAGVVPSIGEQPITPMPEGAIPGIPITSTTGALQTSPVAPSLQPVEQQAPMPAPAPTGLPGPAPVTVSPVSPELQPLQAVTQTPTSVIQPSAELPVTPSTTTTEVTTPTIQTVTPQVPQTAVQTPVEEQPQPEKLITKPPYIVPGEVLTGMPVYVNTETTHIVKPGEDLHWLAAIYYGDARLWYKIYDANKKVIKNPNYLVVGTKLVIPAR
ncbi:MAG: hypothetical protein ACP5T7_01430 [bacterium]